MSKNKIRKESLWDMSAWQNSGSFNYYFFRLMELSMTTFKWNNLPDTMDERFLELTLFLDGNAVVFEDPVIGLVNMKVTGNSPLNIYNIPNLRRGYANNGYNVQLNQDNSVIIFNNILHLPQFLYVRHFADLLWDLDQTIRVNCHAQKTPVIILCDENQRLTMENLYAKYTGNQPFIFGDKNLDINGVKSISTQAPFISDRIYEMKADIWNEALTCLGIPNVNITKKERLVTDEVNRNLGGTIASRYPRLYERQIAADRINQMFGTNISVEIQEELDVSIEQDQNVSRETLGGETDE